MSAGKQISRRSFLTGALAFAALTAAAGCSKEESAVKIGTMPTEDMLPFWIAEQEGLFDANGVKAEVVVFDSAQNLSAAITAKEVDLAMTDIMRTVKLNESGTQLSMEWITLGTTAEQGRFGVITAADSGYKTLKSLLDAKQGVGLADNTVPEYVFDKLCEQAGVDASKIKVSQVAALPERYSLVAAGTLDAAAVPGSLLALAEASGLTVIADDTTGDNISQSVMVARSEFAQSHGTEIENLRKTWDAAVEKVNADPESYRSLLVEKANLGTQIADSYPISSYPLSLDGGSAAYPSSDLVEPVLSWMQGKGYSEKQVGYDPSNGSFTVA